MMFIYGDQRIHLSLCWKCNDISEITAPNLTVFIIQNVLITRKSYIL